MSGMAEVLVAHQRQNSNSCLCGWAKLGHSHSEHQAAMLIAAGFGLVAEAKAGAWDDGALWRHHASGTHSGGLMHFQHGYPAKPINAPNPYRAATVRGE